MAKLPPLRRTIPRAQTFAQIPGPFLVVEHNRVLSRGAKKFDEAEPKAVLVDWRGLFQPFNTDAHVVQYIDPDGAPARLSRQSLTSAREGYFETLRYGLLALDLDNPNHAPWPTDLEAVVRDAHFDLEKLARKLPNPPTAIYLTRAGARFLWALTESVDFTLAMGIQAALAEDVSRSEIPLEVDQVCLGQWGRLFRLPQVVRDGVETWSQGYGRCYRHDGPPLDPKLARVGSIAKLPRTTSAAGAKFDMADAPLPDPQEARALVYVDGDPDAGRTKLGERIRSRLVTQVQRSGDWLDRGGRFRFHGQINARRAIVESRNTTLMQGMSWLSAVLSGVPGCTPEAIYGYIEPMLAATDEETPPPEGAADRGAASWSEYAWGWLFSRWTGDQASIALEREEREKLDEQVEQVRATNLEELGQWLYSLWPQPPTAMKSDPGAWVERHAILQNSTSKTIWILNTTTGGYVDRTLGGIPLATMLAQLGWGQFISLEFITKEGLEISRRDQDILQCHATVVEGKDSDFSENSLSYPQDHPSGFGLSYFEPAFYLNPKLKPVFHAGVDRFLDEIVGSHEEGEKLRALLAHLPDLRGTKLPMIVLAGYPGTGKSMLLKGIQQIWHKRGRVIKQADVMGILEQWNSTMSSTPLVALDETSIANLRRNEISAVFDKLKSLISGSDVAVRRKYEEEDTVSRNYRVIICSNEIGIASVIATSGSRDVDLRSIEAQLLRMESFYIPERETPLMQSQTRGWVTDLHIANHVMWLAQQPAKRWDAVRERGRAHDDIFRVGAAGVRLLRAKFSMEDDKDDTDDAAARMDRELSRAYWDAEDELCTLVLRVLDHCARQNDIARIAFASRGMVVLRASAFDKGVASLFGDKMGKVNMSRITAVSKYLPLAKGAIRKPTNAKIASSLSRQVNPELPDDSPIKWRAGWREVANLTGAIRAAEQYGGCDEFLKIARYAKANP